MGKSKGPYNPEYPAGTMVRIAARLILEDFEHNWKYHNKLDPCNSNTPGRSPKSSQWVSITGVMSFINLKGYPGIWHEVCLEDVAGETV